MTADEETITSLIAIKDKDIVQSPGWWQQLKDAVNHLIVKDFNRLIQILYQEDVSEEKLKNQLRETANTDAAEIIAGLLLERHLQKLNSMQQFKANEAGNCSEEKW